MGWLASYSAANEWWAIAGTASASHATPAAATPSFALIGPPPGRFILPERIGAGTRKMGGIFAHTRRRRDMRHDWLAALAALSLTGCSAAPTARRLAEDAVNTMGGKARLEAIHTLAMKGGSGTR